MIDQVISDNIKKNINDNGYYCLENYINQKELEILKNFVDTKLKENNNQYFF